MSDLKELRTLIDECDNVIASAYVERLKLVEQVKNYKRDNNIEVLNSSREQEILDKLQKNYPENYIQLMDLYNFIMAESRNLQEK